MAKYKVIKGTVGVTQSSDAPVAVTPRASTTAVYRGVGAVVELDDARGEKLVRLGFVAPEGSDEAEAVETPSAPSVTTAAPNNPVNADKAPGDGAEAPRLTEKQQLQADARELGLDDSGTTAELKERIAAAQDEE